MAHFARINEENIVTDVHVVKNCAIGGCIGENDPYYIAEEHESCGNIDFPEQEPIGQQFLAELWNVSPNEFIQCSYNANFRGSFPIPNLYKWDGNEFSIYEKVEFYTIHDSQNGGNE